MSRALTAKQLGLSVKEARAFASPLPRARATRPQERTKHAEAPRMPNSVMLTLPGAPRTKKNSGKIWKAGNRTIIKPSQAWLIWRDTVLHYAKGLTRYGIAQPVNCAAVFYRDADRGDSTGYYQGLADVLEEIGIVANDKYITQWDGSRLLVDKQNPRVEVVLTPVSTPRSA